MCYFCPSIDFAACDQKSLSHMNLHESTFSAPAIHIRYNMITAHYRIANYIKCDYFAWWGKKRINACYVKSLRIVNTEWILGLHCVKIQELRTRETNLMLLSNYPWLAHPQHKTPSRCLQTSPRSTTSVHVVPKWTINFFTWWYVKNRMYLHSILLGDTDMTFVAYIKLDDKTSYILHWRCTELW